VLAKNIYPQKSLAKPLYGAFFVFMRVLSQKDLIALKIAAN
jgi:hypothetical protein